MTRPAVRLYAYLAETGSAIGLLTDDDRVIPLESGEGGLDLVLAEDRLDLLRMEALAAAGARGGNAEPGVPRADLAPLPAVEFPGKIVGIGHNYRAHIEEQHLPIPEAPQLFAKFGNTVVGDGEAVVRPEGTDALDLEVELGVVIGRRARRVPAERAMDHVAGYLVVNDITARDWQGNKAALAEGRKGDGQWLRAKGSDTFFPIGPVFVDALSMPDPHALRLRSWRIPGSGPDAGREVLMQDSTTADMVFRVPELIAYVSRQIALEPGDILSTGTPSGVGVFRVPPVFLQPGDRIRCEVEGIGAVENPIVDWSDVRED
jgi:2-keto-4-pentenoate hydratase/2-oxohepta-3-ene-1,7-dioic acid hydratase in catechol pathway